MAFSFHNFAPDGPVFDMDFEDAVQPIETEGHMPANLGESGNTIEGNGLSQGRVMLL
jgi:hypothetical protein